MAQTLMQDIICSPPPPIDYNPISVKSFESTEGWVEITDVPCYVWSYGCYNTCLAMLAGYYDRKGYNCLYNGKINGGLAPLSNSSWIYNPIAVSCVDPSLKGMNYENEISATHKGYFERTTNGHVDDFWSFYEQSSSTGYADPYPYLNDQRPHNFNLEGSICTADYLGTSQDYFNNADGQTTVFNKNDNTKLYDYSACESEIPKYRDVSHGIKLFFYEATNGEHDVASVYNQNVYGKGGINAGFTFDDYKNEIDNNRPVIINFEGHTVLGFGYRNLGKQIMYYSTWSTNKETVKWGSPIYTSSGSALDLNSVTVVIPNSSTIADDPNEPCEYLTTGLYDDVSIKNPPSNTEFPPSSGNIMEDNIYELTPGASFNLYAEFSSTNCDTYTETFNWRIELFYDLGEYEYMSSTTQGYPNWPSSCRSCSQWQDTAPLTNLPDYKWQRNPDGSIHGRIIVETIDNNGYINTSDEAYIRLNYSPNMPSLNIIDYEKNSITLQIESEGAVLYRANTGFQTDQGNSPIYSNNNIISITGWQPNDYINIQTINSFGFSNESTNLYNKTFEKLPYSTTFTEQEFSQWNFSVGSSSSQVVSDNGYDDNNCLRMDALNNNEYYHNIADLYLNLLNENEVYLNFYLIDFYDEDHEQDGIYLSVDGGISFHKIYNFIPSNYPNNSWMEFSVNISELAANNNLKLTEHCILRFSHYDNYTISSDGFLVDNVNIYSSFVPESNYFEDSLIVDKDALLLYSEKPGYEYIETTNFGTSSILKADEWTNSGYRTNSKSLFQFDLSQYPSEVNVKSAYLSLYSNTPQPTDDYKHMSGISTGNTSIYKSNACIIERVVEPWDENSVTYNSSPQTISNNAVYLPVSTSYNQNYLDIDVTKMVSDLIKYPASDNGFMLSLANEEKYARMSFASSNHSNTQIHPHLILDYYFDETIYTIPFTVTGSTTSENDDWNVGYNDGKDKAYLVYIPETIYFNASTCSSNSNFDTMFEIFKANKISTGIYNDDASNCTYDLLSTVTNQELSEGFYYFVVDGYGGDEGDFELIVEESIVEKSAYVSNLKLNNEESSTMIVKFFPNPVQDYLHITSSFIDATANIIDMNGRVVLSTKINSNQSIINCANIKNGIYILKILTDQKVYTYSLKKIN